VKVARARRVGEGRAATARIAIDIRVTQGGYPGIGRATTGLVEALLHRDTPHRLLLLHDTDRCLPASLAAALRPPHALLPIGSALRSARDQFELPLRLRQARADLYHSPYYAMALRPGCPYLLQVFDLIPERYPRYWRWPQPPVIRRWLQASAKGAALIVAPSEATATDLRALYRIPAARIRTIPLAVDPRWLDSATMAPPAGTPPPIRPYLLCVCTNKPHKNLVRLIEAFGSVEEWHAPAPDLVLAGGWDPRYPEAQRAADAYASAAGPARGGGAIRFVHAPEDAALADLYHSALGFVFPSEYEGFGLPVLEAMSIGLPVAASGTPAVAEVAGDACLRFDPLGTASIAAAIRSLAGDPALRARLGAAGRARAAGFSWQEAARLTLAAYGEVLCA